MYVAGVIGLFFPQSRPVFSSLTAFNLWVSAFLLYFFSNTTIQARLLILALCGYLIEVTGVHTGHIFGQYYYGPTLGWAVLEVPITIGFTWAILCLGSAYTVLYFLPNISNKWLFGLCGALITTLLDVLIEPVAIYFNFWQWHRGIIPLQNYLAWFICSFVLIYSLLEAAKKNQNNIAIHLLLLQALFFISLNVLLTL
jgi:uncharacterized membrane protein